MNLKIYTDGGSRGNPGHSAIGVVIYDNDTGGLLQKFGSYLGPDFTCNHAEYTAAIRALEVVHLLYSDIESIDIFMDSMLVVQQMNRVFKVKAPEMKLLFNRLDYLSKKFKTTFTHILREFNQAADKEVNIALNNILRN